MTTRKKTVLPSNLSVFRADGTNGATPVAGTVITNQITTDIVMGDVGLMVRAGGLLNNINILECSFNGNPAISKMGKTDAADGLVWCQWTGGNWFAARNTLTNYCLEAFQFNSGPAAVVQNRLFTDVSGIAACALHCSMTGPATGPSAQRPDLSICLAGNEVTGGRQGLLSESSDPGPEISITRVLVTGNRFTLYPAYQEFGDEPGAAAWVWRADCLNVTGNTLLAGGLGARLAYGVTNIVVLKNDFGTATQLAIDSRGLPGHTLSSQIIKNRLGCGVSFHLRAPMADGSGHYLCQNLLLDSNSAPAALFCEPLALPIHSKP